MSDKTKYTAVATKLSPYANERLEKIARKKGMTKYDIIQMMCDVAIRYMDDRKKGNSLIAIRNVLKMRDLII